MGQDSLVLQCLLFTILSNLPIAQAQKEQIKKVCEIVCSPLPGEKKDAPERVCQETCKKGTEIVGSKTWIEKFKNRAWISVGGSLLDCTAICTGEFGTHSWGIFVTAKDYFWDGNKAQASKNAFAVAAKMFCSATSYTRVGVAGCMTCCTGLKWLDYNF